MVDVAGGADDPTCFMPGTVEDYGAEHRDLGRLDGPAVQQETVVGEPAEDGQAGESQRLVEALGRARRRAEGQGRRRKLDGGERAAADLRARLDDRRAERARRVRGGPGAGGGRAPGSTRAAR